MNCIEYFKVTNIFKKGLPRCNNRVNDQGINNDNAGVNTNSIFSNPINNAGVNTNSIFSNPINNVYDLKVPTNLNKSIILIYDLINDPYMSAVFKKHFIYSKNDSIKIYDNYKLQNIYHRYDVGIRGDNIILSCNLRTGLLYFNDNILHEFTFYDWFKSG